VSTAAANGDATRNTHDNFLAAAAKIGLGLRDIPPCVTFFAPVSVDAGGRFIWNAARKRAGDFVDLRAEMNLVLAMSNCPQPARSGASRGQRRDHPDPPPRATGGRGRSMPHDVAGSHPRFHLHRSTFA